MIKLINLKIPLANNITAMQYEIKKKQFENGANLFYLQTPSDDISLIANINAGSLYENDFNNGISHLVEHCIFKGTPRRPSRDFIYNEIRLLGGKIYCHTEVSSIPLGFRVILEDFEHTLDLTSDLLYNSNMDDKEVEKEKEIVLSEIRERSDNPYIYLWDKFNEELFKGSLYSKPIIGYEEIVKNLNTGEVKEFYKKMFTPANTNVFVVGPIDYKEAEEKIYEYFGKINGGEHHPVPDIIPKGNPGNMILKKELENINLMMGNLVFPSTIEEKYALDVLTTTLSRSISDKILNQEPISYDRWTAYHRGKSFGEIKSYATSKPKDYNKMRALIEEEFLKYSRGDIPESYITNSIESEKKGFILGYTTTMAKAKLVIDYWSLGNVEEVNHYIKNLNNLTFEQVIELSKKYINLEDMLYVSLGNLE